MEDPKDKANTDKVTEDDQTNLDLGNKEEISTVSPDDAAAKTSASSNKGQGPSGEDL